MTGRSNWRFAAALTLVVMALSVTAPAAAFSFTATQDCEVTVLSTQQSRQLSRIGLWGAPLLGGFFGQHYSSIQTAVAASTAGDTLLVRGTCTGTTTIDKNLTLTGEATEFGPWGLEPESLGPTLNGLQTGSVLTIDGGATVQVEGLTITGGKSNSGGGIYNAGTLTIRNSRIEWNTATQEGGGILNFGTLTITANSAINRNTATEYGGGIYSQGGTMKITNGSMIDDNYADFGGGIFTVTNVTISASQLDGNSAVEGGGIFCGDDFTVTITNGSIIHGNKATTYGGGISNFGVISVSHSRIAGNSAGSGGGINNNDVGTVKIYAGGTIDHNTAENTGGGILNDGLLIGATSGVNVYDNTPNDIAS